MGKYKLNPFTNNLDRVTTSEEVDHGLLTGLSDDDHTQYALLNGRSGGQTLNGDTNSGGNLNLKSTSNSTKGKIYFGVNSVYDEFNDRIGVNKTSPTSKIHAKGSTSDNSSYGLKIDNSSDVNLLQVRNDGAIMLSNTTNTNKPVGAIYKGTNIFIHDFNYGNNGTVTTEGKNTFIGELSGNFTMGSTATSSSHSSKNTIVGYRNFINNTTGYSNTVLGVESLLNNNTGNQNVAIGTNALFGNTSGYQNVGIGAGALQLSQTGYANIGIGSGALYSFNAAGGQNTGIGDAALYNITTGSSNTGIGAFAGRNIADGSTANQTSYNSVYIGHSTKASANGNSNETVIGYNATGNGTNTVTLGNSSVTKTYLAGLTSSNKFKHTQISASLTDDAPTNAELNTATGLTPSTAGAGWMATIKDSDGSGKLYRVESDGTDWYYVVMNKAL